MQPKMLELHFLDCDLFERVVFSHPLKQGSDTSRPKFGKAYASFVHLVLKTFQHFTNDGVEGEDFFRLTGKRKSVAHTLYLAKDDAAKSPKSWQAVVFGKSNDGMLLFQHIVARDADGSTGDFSVWINPEFISRAKIRILVGGKEITNTQTEVLERLIKNVQDMHFRENNNPTITQREDQAKTKLVSRESIILVGILRSGDLAYTNDISASFCRTLTALLQADKDLGSSGIFVGACRID